MPRFAKVEITVCRYFLKQEITACVAVIRLLAATHKKIVTYNNENNTDDNSNHFILDCFGTDSAGVFEKRN